MENRVSTLIIAKPGRVRDCLQKALGAITSVEVVGQPGNGSSARAIIARHQPALVLLYSDQPGDESWVTTLRQIKTDWPQTSCLVLADNVREQQAAKAGGADGALLKCTRARELFATVERLLPRGAM